MEVDNDQLVDHDVGDDAGDEVHNHDDLQFPERLRLGNESDDDDVIPPLEHGVENLDMRDSDDETYDPAKTYHDKYF